MTKSRIKSLIETLKRTGEEYRAWSHKDAKQGNHARAYRFHKMAENNLAEVKWWMAW